METRHDLDRKGRKEIAPSLKKGGVYEVVEREDGTFDYVPIKEFTEEELDVKKDDVPNSDPDKREQGL